MLGALGGSGRSFEPADGDEYLVSGWGAQGGWPRRSGGWSEVAAGVDTQRKECRPLSEGHEETEGRAGPVGTIKSRDGRSLEVRRYCQPRLRPWAEGAPGSDRYGSPPRSQLRCTPPPLRFASHSLSASILKKLPTSPASGRLLPPGPPENLACGASDTAHYGLPLRAPGRTETPGKAIQNNTINKIRGGRQPPDRLRRTHPVPTPLHAGQLARLRPAAALTQRPVLEPAT
ncbi:MAG: hypothetical protein ACI8RZ_003082 [Myxococcota bacterium]